MPGYSATCGMLTKETTVRTEYETIQWFKIRREVAKVNLYAKYITLTAEIKGNLRNPLWEMKEDTTAVVYYCSTLTESKV